MDSRILFRRGHCERMLLRNYFRLGELLKRFGLERGETFAIRSR